MVTPDSLMSSNISEVAPCSKASKLRQTVKYKERETVSTCCRGTWLASKVQGDGVKVPACLSSADSSRDQQTDGSSYQLHDDLLAPDLRKLLVL